MATIENFSYSFGTSAWFSCYSDPLSLIRVVLLLRASKRSNGTACFSWLSSLYVQRLSHVYMHESSQKSGWFFLSRKSPFLWQAVVAGCWCRCPLPPDTLHSVFRPWKYAGGKKKHSPLFDLASLEACQPCGRSCSLFIWVSPHQQRVSSLPERTGRSQCRFLYGTYKNFTTSEVTASLFFYSYTNTSCPLVNSEHKNM